MAVRKKPAKKPVEDKVEVEETTPVEDKVKVEETKPVEDKVKVEDGPDGSSEEDSGLGGNTDDLTDTDDGSSEEDEDVVLAFTTVAEVNAYMADASVSLEDKLEALGAGAYTPLRGVVSSLLSIISEFSADKPERDAKYILGKLFGLYSTMKAIVETEDTAEFKLRMDILNLVFRKHSAPDDAFYPARLLRFDFGWTWGAESLKTYQVLCTVINALADLSTREEELGKININNNFARTNLTISQEHIDRLIRYYAS